MDYTKDYVLILKESLERKIGILNQLKEYNDEQKKLCSAENFDIEAYDVLVEKKSKLADDLETIDGGFSSVYDRVSTELKENKDKYSSDIADMQRYIALITDMIAGIQADEKRIFEMAKSKLDIRRKEVVAAKKSNQIAANYYKSMSRTSVSDPQFMDKKK